MRHRLGELAERVGGRVHGDPDRWIHGVASLEEAGPDAISFLTHRSYRKAAFATSAGALVVAGHDPRFPADLLICDEPTQAVARILEIFHPRTDVEPGLHPTAVVDPDAVVDPLASVGAFCAIGSGSIVEPGARLGAHVTVGRDCRIGRDAILHPQVVLYDGTVIGDRSVVHAGTVIGADGFGYVTADGTLRKVPQVGTVTIGADVEIGANSAVDRATLGMTRVGRGTKIDNLVQVGHNAQIGESCLLCGQVGIAGSARLGNGVVMAGQSGASGHIVVGDGAQIAAQSAALRSVPAGETVAGTPARKLSVWKRFVVLSDQLQSFRDRITRLEREVAAARTGEPARDDDPEA